MRKAILKTIVLTLLALCVRVVYKSFQSPLVGSIDAQTIRDGTVAFAAEKAVSFDLLSTSFLLACLVTLVLIWRPVFSGTKTK